MPAIATWRGAILLAALGAAADLDLLIGAHRTYTHSLGACIVITLIAMALTPSSEPRLLTGLACGAAYASHLLLDWLGNDGAPPIGLMALWPFSSDYYESSLHWFLSTERRFWLPQFWTLNVIAVAREIGTLLPITAAIWWLRRRKV
jgi:inner membrane protein